MRLTSSRVDPTRPHAGYGNAPEEAAVAAETSGFVHRHLGLTA